MPCLCGLGLNQDFVRAKEVFCLMSYIPSPEFSVCLWLVFVVQENSISYFTAAVIKHHNQDNFQMEKVIWACPVDKSPSWWGGTAAYIFRHKPKAERVLNRHGVILEPTPVTHFLQKGCVS